MGEENFRLSRARDLDLGSGHTAYRHASLVDLYLHINFHWNRSNFLWTDGRTDGRTFETHFIRSTRRSRPKIRLRLVFRRLWATECVDSDEILSACRRSPWVYSSGPYLALIVDRCRSRSISAKIVTNAVFGHVPTFNDHGEIWDDKMHLGSTLSCPI